MTENKLRAIILAAGTGSRFGYYPKGLLEVNGMPIIQRLVNQLKDAGVEEVFVVVGYRASEFFKIEGVSFIFDKSFPSGKNSLSLKVALDTIGMRDTLMLDADLIVSEGLISYFVENFKGNSISLVDLTFDDDEAMKVVIDNGKIVGYSKDKGIGAEVMTIVSKEKLKEIYKDLDHTKWWGVGEHATGFGYVEIRSGDKWMDIDTWDEYEVAIQKFVK